MADYPEARSKFNPDWAARGQQLLTAAVPIRDGTATFRYLTEQRGLPADLVLAAPDQLYLPSAAQGRGPDDHALLSVLRVKPDGEPTGIQATWLLIDDTPAPVSETRRKRDYFAFVEDGCRDACWWGGAESDTKNGTKSEQIYAAEGFAEKPLALLAAGVDDRVIGFGSRSVRSS
jgi:hypothetical protein